MKHRVVRAFLIALLTSTHAVVFVESLSAQAADTKAKGAREFVRLRATLDACAASHFVVSAASDLLAFSCEDKTVQLWDVASGRLTLTLRGFAKPTAVLFSRDGGRLAILEDGKSVSVWDARTGAKQATVRNTGRDFSWLKWSPDGRTLMTVMRDDSLKADFLMRERTEFALWDVATGLLKSKVTIKERDARATFSPDGQTILTTGSKHDAQLWDVATGELRATLRPVRMRLYDEGTRGGFLAGGRQVVVGGGVRPVHLWDAATGGLEATLVGQPDIGELQALRSASPDGRLILIYRERFKSTWSFKLISSVELRDSRTGKLTAELTGANMRGAAHQVAWSRDGRVLFTAGGSKKYDGKLWDVATGRRIATIPLVAKLSRSPLVYAYNDLDRLSPHPALPVLMTASNKLIRFWDASDGALIQTLEGTGEPARWTTGGRTLVSLTADGRRVQLWDVVEKLSASPAHDGLVEDFEALYFGNWRP